MPETLVIGFDRADNRDLSRLPSYRGFRVDLDSLRPGASTRAVREHCHEVLSRVRGDDTFVECLVEGAGVYEYGALADMDDARILRVFGINLVGHLAVLRAVLEANGDRGVSSRAALSYIEVGSTYGLAVDEGRSIYAASKAAMLAVTAAVALGGEVHRSIYLAPGPIDTAMLHRNHWVSKAGGDRSFYERVAAGPRDLYERIFVRCELEALRELRDSSASADAFVRYRRFRQQAFDKETGRSQPSEVRGDARLDHQPAR